MLPIEIGYGDIGIWIHDNTYLTILNIYPDHILFRWDMDTQPIKFYYYMNTTDNFHKYTVTGKEKSIKLFVDDINIFDEVVTRGWAGSEELIFGDLDISNPSVSEWDYFSYYVTIPEPCSLLLFALGGLLIRKR
jgi:hypothetical protein